MADNKGMIPPQYDLDAKWDACLDLTVRRFVYSSFAGAFGGLLFFSQYLLFLFSVNESILLNGMLCIVAKWPIICASNLPFSNIDIVVLWFRFSSYTFWLSLIKYEGVRCLWKWCCLNLWIKSIHFFFLLKKVDVILEKKHAYISHHILFGVNILMRCLILPSVSILVDHSSSLFPISALPF